MSVPTHNLYDFVHQATKRQFMLSYFLKWGSRNLADVCWYQISNDWLNGPKGIPSEYRANCPTLDHASLFHPVLFCHDQEPLDFDLYLNPYNTIEEQKLMAFVSPANTTLNLRWHNIDSLQKYWVLLHSELNSDQVKQYESTGMYKGAFWWSHAVIARDWYRYAEYDTTLCADATYSKLFLVYCRATTGSREYRKQFMHQLHSTGLLDNCQTKSFHNQEVGSDASAIYEPIDFNQTGVSVVLETVFEKRIHLTEKILRPIACGHPFILAAGPGSLAKLRSYGFCTFSPYIDESYDEIQNDQERIAAIIKSMQKFKELDPEIQCTALAECRKIAAHNRSRFFSKDFFDAVCTELRNNVFAAYTDVLDLQRWWEDHKWRRLHRPESLKDPKYKQIRNCLLPLYRRQRMMPSQSSSGSDSLKDFTRSEKCA